MNLRQSYGDELTGTKSHDQVSTSKCATNFTEFNGILDLLTLVRSFVGEQITESLSKFTQRLDERNTEITELLSQFTQRLDERLQKHEDNLVQNSCSRNCHISPPQDAKSSVSRSLKLHFLGGLPDELMTLDHIKTEGASLMVELQDSSGQRVATGPESSLKIKIVVLDGDCDFDDVDDLTAHKFDKIIAQPRKDKGPLLKGKCEIVMKNGAAVFEDLAFTDNSKSMRNGMFKLGARVVGSLPEGVMIKEAVSKAFKVKERRVKFYRRNKALSLKDDPEHLLHIGKTLAQKLAAENILTVQDFLQLYHTDKQVLESILRLSDNRWSELVKNANSCPLSQAVYEYSDSDSGIGLVLDCVFNIQAVVLNRTILKLYSALDDSMKDNLNKIRCKAYKKRKELQESPTLTLKEKKCEFGTTYILHSNAQHLYAVETDIENVPITRLVNPAINKERPGQDICSFPPDQIHQGTERLLHPNSVVGHCAAVGHKKANYNQVHQTLATSSVPELPMDQSQDLSFQQSFPALPNEFFDGLGELGSTCHRTWSPNVNTEDNMLSLLTIDEPEINIEGSNPPFDSGVQCHFLMKRPRYN